MRIQIAVAAAAAIMAATTIGGCSRMSTKDVTVEGLPYSFPKDHIFNIVQPHEGSISIRLHPPREKFALRLHKDSDRKQKEQNTVIIPTINSSRFSTNWSKTPTSVGDVFCTPDFPHYNCGFELYDGGIRWSVLFDREHLADVSNMKNAAVELLTEYRGRYANGRRAN